MSLREIVKFACISREIYRFIDINRKYVFTDTWRNVQFKKSKEKIKTMTIFQVCDH